MAISYVGGQVSGRAGATTTSNVTFSFSGGSNTTPSEGDLVVVTIVVGTAGRTPSQDISGQGYTVLTQQNANGTTYDTSMVVAYKFMGSTPDTLVTMPSTGNNQDAQRWTIQCFRGVDATTPMDATPVPATGTGTGRPNPGAILPVTAGAWVTIHGGGAAGTGANYTAPANFTTNFLTGFTADTNDAIVGSGYWSGWSSGSVDPGAYTGGTTNATDSWAAYTLSLRPQVLNNYLLETTPESFSLAGSSARTTAGFSVGTSAGTASITGFDAELEFFAAPSAFQYDAFQSDAFQSKEPYQIIVTPGVYSLTGASASALAAKRLETSPGSYAIAGAVASLLNADLLQTTPGSYAISGNSATTLFWRLAQTTSGSYAMTGQSATTLPAFSASITPVSYALTGQSATTLRTSLLQTTPGSYALTGSSAQTLAAKLTTTTAGACTLTGSSAELIYGAVTGFTLDVTPGAYAISGQPARITLGAIAATTPGAYTLTGQSAAALLAARADAVAVAYSISGQQAATLASRALSTTPSSLAISGQVAQTLRSAVVQTTPGVYILSGQSAETTQTYAVTTTPGVYAITGQPVGMIYSGDEPAVTGQQVGGGFIYNMGTLMNR